MFYTTLSPYSLANDHDNDNRSHTRTMIRRSIRLERLVSQVRRALLDEVAGAVSQKRSAMLPRAGKRRITFLTRCNVDAAGKGCNGRSYHAARRGRGSRTAVARETAVPRQRGVRRARASGSSGCVPRRRPPGGARGAPGEDPRAAGRAICCGARGVLSAKYSAVVDTRRRRRRSPTGHERGIRAAHAGTRRGHGAGRAQT